MTEKDLLKQLKELKNIKPDTNWAISARADIVRMVNEDTISSTRHSFEGAKEGFSILFSSLPRSSFSLIPVVALALLLVVSMNLLSFESLEFGGLALKTVQIKIVQINNTETEAGNLINANLSTENSTPTFTENTSFDNDNTLASLKSYNDDVSTAFRAMLIERINRITVLGQESRDIYTMQLAQQAQELYEYGDYDSALRVLIYAENQLGLN